MNSHNKPIRLGLCCINTQLRTQNPPIFSSRSCILKTIYEKGIDECIRRANQNLDDLIPMMKWNWENNISVFRLSSDIFPHITNIDKIDISKYNLTLFEDKLRKIGRIAKLFRQRLTFHPGQYNVLATPNPLVYRKTIYELYVHARILDLMGCDKNSVMCIHGGGVYGNKVETIKRWCRNYKKLPKFIRKRIVLENCEKSFNIEDCLKISRKTGVPVVLDNHHFYCYNQIHPNIVRQPIEYYIPLVLKTWTKKDMRPKVHISEQGCGRTGNHSDLIESLPNYYLEIPEKYNIEIDIMIEAKLKEQAIQKLYRLYPFLIK